MHLIRTVALFKIVIIIIYGTLFSLYKGDPATLKGVFQVAQTVKTLPAVEELVGCVSR